MFLIPLYFKLIRSSKMQVNINTKHNLHLAILQFRHNKPRNTYYNTDNTDSIIIRYSIYAYACKRVVYACSYPKE